MRAITPISFSPSCLCNPVKGAFDARAIMLSDKFIRKYRCSILVIYLHTHYWICSEYMPWHCLLCLFDCQTGDIRERKTVTVCSHKIPNIYFNRIGKSVDLEYRYRKNNRGYDEAKRRDEDHHCFDFQVRRRAEWKIEVIPGLAHQEQKQWREPYP